MALNHSVGLEKKTPNFLHFEATIDERDVVLDTIAIGEY